jgi:hypothetical protein
MSNPPLALTLSVWQGQTFNDSLAVMDDTGVAVDLTGFTAKMMARVALSDVTPKLTWGTATGEIVLGGTAGTITFNVPAATTATLAGSEDLAVWMYDLVLDSPSGVTERIVQGALVIYPGVTR